MIDRMIDRKNDRMLMITIVITIREIVLDTYK